MTTIKNGGSFSFDGQEDVAELGDKIKGVWFPTYKVLIAAIDAWLRDGDTVLIKSSHATHLDHAVKYLCS